MFEQRLLLESLTDFQQDGENQQVTKKRGGTYPLLIQRSLTYYFWQGEEVDQRHHTPREVYDAIAGYIRRGEINADIVTAPQMKAWFNTKTQLRRQRPSDFQKPAWVRPNQPSCIWSNHNDVAHVIPQQAPAPTTPSMSSHSNSIGDDEEDDQEDEDNLGEAEMEEEPSLFLDGPSWMRRCSGARNRPL